MDRIIYHPIKRSRMEDELFTPIEVAERLRVNREVVYKWLKNGKLKGVHAGRHWRVRRSDLDAFLNQ